MRRYINQLLMISLVAGLLSAVTVGKVYASGVCSNGNSEPPFLAYGAKSNLLMLLDNSGSMLDMAYTDPDTDGVGTSDAATQCFDESFLIDPGTGLVDSTMEYAGSFEYVDGTSGQPVWYKWNILVSPWKNILYGVNDIVTYGGSVYRALTAGVATGSNIHEDTGVSWEQILRPGYHDAKWYHAGSYIFTDTKRVYRRKTNGISNGATLSVDMAFWEEITRFTDGTTYSAGTYVLGENFQLFHTVNGGISSGARPTEDTSVEWLAVDYHEWQPDTYYAPYDIVTYRGMIYVATLVNLITTRSVGNNIYEDNYAVNWIRLDEGYFEQLTEVDARSYCSGASAATYSGDDLCVAIDNSGAGTSQFVAAFAASGNFLNWATASKFDIQKDILTGGKYNIEEQRLISENRGCGGNRFVKQYRLDSGEYLTMSIRKPDYDGRVDISDDTTRFEIYAITASGMDFDKCQDAIDAFQDPGGLGPAESDVEACVGFDPASGASMEHIIYHKGIQECWFYAKHGRWKGGVDHPLMTCPKYYALGNDPAGISPFDPGYVCNGIYDSGPHDQREGFVGRCWETFPAPSAGSCVPKPCSLGCSSYPCYLEIAGVTHRCLADGFEDYCSGNFNSKQETCNKPWVDIYWDNVTHVEGCTPAAPAAPDYWSGNLDGIPGDIAPEPDPDAVADVCVNQAMHDYCLQTELPEVIDPSDQATETSEFWNLPAILIDTGLAGQLGGEPLDTMKVHIKQTSQPTGILHKNASDLRIGAMAFNDNGAGSECGAATVPDQIVQYCPSSNQDGAHLITPVRLGSLQTGAATHHVDDLVAAINRVRATSWTPLAEAVYNAIGYYTQNSLLRINDSDYQTDADVTAGWQTNKYYGTGFYILNGGILYKAVDGGFSTGVSMAADSGVTWSAVASPLTVWNDNTVYGADSIVTFAGKLYHTVAGGLSTLKDEAAAEGLSGPLYDAGVVWEFLIDPVVNHCQGNYILIISEGASTADIHADVESFVLGSHPFNTTAINDDASGLIDAPAVSQCADGLQGSSYVDDLTYFAKDSSDQFVVYPAANATLPESDYPFDQKEKNNITTYVVTAGLPRDNGSTDECNPVNLMESIALNGGTGEALKGESPQELEDNLLAIFNSLRQRASAGSAASVISSARGGEGAIYQAIFWPDLKRTDNQGTVVTTDDVEYSVAWAGDVHGLFLDARGYMYEDTDGNRTLNPSEDLDGDNHLDCGEDLDCNGILDPGEDLDLDGQLDLNEDLDGDGVFNLAVDLDGDGVADISEDIDGDGHFDQDYEDRGSPANGSLDSGDKRVVIYFDNTAGIERSRVCWNSSIFDTLGEYCTNAGEIDEIHFLWSANQWLSEYPVVPAAPDDLAVLTNRSDAAGVFNADSRQRYIFTWNDDADGIVETGEVVPFVANADGGPDWNSVASDFDVQSGLDVDKIIRWMRGEDFLIDEDLNDNGILDIGEDLNGNGQLDGSLRSRQSLLFDPDNINNSYQVTWRLGDVIHSTPMTVSAPAEGYHLIYNDYSYAQFVNRWKNRRHMVYFGANDGMLHAVNGGFYQSDENKFYLGYDYTNRIFNDTGMKLGTEVWAYVPYNLHPHLSCLTDPMYSHKYFVDQRPRIFDVQIFEEESACSDKSAEACIHPNGWGTILVGGMRYGGTPIGANELVNSSVGDTREFISSYFILDITNPEAPPELLGELTRKTGAGVVDLGYSSVIPTMVIMKDKGATSSSADDVNKWYLILGSGPHDYDAVNNNLDLGDIDGVKGMSDQGAKISVLPLDWLVDTMAAPGKTALSIPAAAPTSTTSGGTFPAPGAQIQSFVSDLVTVDYDINPSYNEYKSDAVYFGTVEGETHSGRSGFDTYADGATYWNGGGHMYRLVMEPYDSSSTPPGGHTVALSTGEPVSEPQNWEVTTLLNLGSMRDWAGNIVPQVSGHPMQPVTSAASIGTDGYNFWVYFGTGRFFSPEDKTDRQQQSYYGIKEPMEIVLDPDGTRKRRLTWEEVEFNGSPSFAPGNKGLVKVDEILVGESSLLSSATLTCRDNENGGNVGNHNCMEPVGGSLPAGMVAGGMDFYSVADDNAYLDKLERFIAGTGICTSNGCTTLADCQGTDYNDVNYKNNCSDGWRKDFWPYGNREKNVGQATLLGGLVTFTTYQPNSGVCQAEGSAYLYGVYYKTGTSWYENIFGAYGIDSIGNVKNKLSLGRGLATTPNLHIGSGDDGDGPKAFVQTSTGEIKEIQQENLPINSYRTGRTQWKEYIP